MKAFATLWQYIATFFFLASGGRGFYLDPRPGNDNTVNHYANKFDDDVKLVFQQKQSRLEDTVIVDNGIVGYSKSFDTLGQADMQPVDTQNEDVKHANLTSGRRWIDLTDFDWADYVSSFDKLRILEDPTNKYVTAGLAAANRRKDKTIIDAALGTARETTGYGSSIVTTQAALPAAQKVLHGGTNITLAKIRTGKEILETAEAGTEDEDQITIVITASQLNLLLDDQKISSADYNSVRALVDGKINHFLGAEWKRVQSLPKTAGNVRSCLMYAKSAMGLGIGEDINTDVSQRKDKRGLPWQVYIKLTLGAVRGLDAGVVEIQCQE